MKLTKENFMLFNDNWALVTAGSLTNYNTMTISWGSLGCIWNGEDSARPIVSVYVKPCRYTHDFIEKTKFLRSHSLIRNISPISAFSAESRAATAIKLQKRHSLRLRLAAVSASGKRKQQ